ISTNKYGDFILIVDWRLDPKLAAIGPSGGAAVELVGARCDVLINRSGMNSGTLHLTLPSTSADRPIGEWNRFEITRKAGRVSVLLNGTKVAEDDVAPTAPGRGEIGLRSAGVPIQFANIYIRPL